MQGSTVAVTQTEIAREAGVSQTIVSDVLQGRVRGRVRPETRERILQTAQRLGYQPNAMAQALRSRQSRQIAYLTSATEAKEFAALRESDLSGVARTLQAQGYRLLIEVPATHERETAALAEMTTAGICDGGVIRAYRGSEALWNALKAIPQPVVVIGQCPDPELPSVAHDLPAIMAAAVQQLIERGHRRLGLIVDGDHGLYQESIIAEWNTLANDHSFDPVRWFSESSSRSHGHALVEEWLSGEDTPTAIISLDTGAALGAAAAIRDKGAKLGKGFDLVVINDIQTEWFYEPGTLFFPLDPETVGVRAAQELLAMLAGGPRPGPIRLTPQMVQI
jgi:LacI family transcriptional regulator